MLIVRHGFLILEQRPVWGSVYTLATAGLFPSVDLPPNQKIAVFSRAWYPHSPLRQASADTLPYAGAFCVPSLLCAIPAPTQAGGFCTVVYFHGRRPYVVTKKEVLISLDSWLLRPTEELSNRRHVRAGLDIKLYHMRTSVKSVLRTGINYQFHCKFDLRDFQKISGRT